MKKPRNRVGRLLHEEIKFVLNGKQMSFNVVHNLDEFGLDIMAAFANWQVRTPLKYFTEQNFCNYVRSKDPFNFICMTKAVFDNERAKFNN